MVSTYAPELVPQSGNTTSNTSLGVLTIQPQIQPRLRSNNQLLGLLYALATSAVTSGADFWFPDRRQQTSSVFSPLFQRIQRRQVSLSEARAIALEILAQAELERLQLAGEEAQRGIQWEELR